MNALTVFGVERCRQSKRKLDVLVRCMHTKLASFLNFFVMYWTLALSTVNVTRIKSVISFWEIMVCLS